MSLISRLFGSFSSKESNAKNIVEKVNEEVPEKKRTTKIDQVRKHLETHGSITSWEAITNYGATRLSAYIFRLRRKDYEIDSIGETVLDRNGNTTTFVRYHLVRKPLN